MSEKQANKVSDDIDQAVRRPFDVKVLDGILNCKPDLHVNTCGESRIALPFTHAAVKKYWPLNHRRTRAAIAGFAYKTEGKTISVRELNRVLVILEDFAWNDERIVVQIQLAADEDPLVEALFILLNDTNSASDIDWPAARLLKELEKVAIRNSINTKTTGWPNGAAQLSRRLEDLRALLKSAGVSIERGRRSGGHRFIKLTRDDECDDVEQPPSPASTDENSASPDSLASTDDGDAITEPNFDSIRTGTKRTTQST